MTQLRKYCLLCIMMSTAFVLQSGVYLAAIAAQQRNADAPAILSKDKAIIKVSNILLGDPYGKTIKEVRQNIIKITYSKNGSNRCGGVNIKKSIWIADVLVPAERNKNGKSEIRGIIIINDKSGIMECTTLPYLD